MVRRYLDQDENKDSSRAQQDIQLSIRVLTHNIRYATSSLFPNERPWKERFPLIMSQFKYNTRFHCETLATRYEPSSKPSSGHFNASFICMQEVLHDQLFDIVNSLNGNLEQGSRVETPVWSYIGVGREDGKTKGEYSPILYPAQVFDLLHFENTWLSPTPGKPSKGWDAGSERILTTGVFEHKATKKRIAVFNTHLDNAGSVAREESVAIILETIERVRQEWKVSTKGAYADADNGLEYILAGDFNSFPTQEAYKAMKASRSVVDVYETVPNSERYGNEVTFTGFQPDTDRDKDDIGRIDFVWLGPKSRVVESHSMDGSEGSVGWTVNGYAVLPNVFDDGVFCSDHRCVVADATLT